MDEARITTIWDGDTYIYLMHINGEHVFSAYSYKECVDEAMRKNARIRRETSTL